MLKNLVICLLALSMFACATGCTSRSERKPLRIEAGTVAGHDVASGFAFRLDNGNWFLAGARDNPLDQSKLNLPVGSKVSVKYFLTSTKLAVEGTDETIEVTPLPEKRKQAEDAERRDKDHQEFARSWKSRQYHYLGVGHVEGEGDRVDLHCLSFDYDGEVLRPILFTMISRDRRGVSSRTTYPKLAIQGNEIRIKDSVLPYNCSVKPKGDRVDESGLIANCPREQLEYISTKNRGVFKAGETYVSNWVSKYFEPMKSNAHGQPFPPERKTFLDKSGEPAPYLLLGDWTKPSLSWTDFKCVSLEEAIRELKEFRSYQALE
jgi:hypothetical protein